MFVQKPVSHDSVKRLREATGCTFDEAYETLTQTRGNMDSAEVLLRETGYAVAKSRSRCRTCSEVKEGNFLFCSDGCIWRYKKPSE